MALIEQRKAQEAANRERSSAMGHEQPAPENRAGTDSAMKKSVTFRADGKKSTVKKAKTEVAGSNGLDTDTKENADEAENAPKCEESDDESDSEPSEDNLDEDQILALIPKKFGKRKYLKGLDHPTEKKKKKVKKPKERKPETELMPCLQSRRKEIEARRKAEEAEKEKLSEKPKARPYRPPITISKPVLHQKRNGVQVRDVATHIKYHGNGTNLSLMEIDILNHTGCKWSRVIYPAYKGHRSEFRSERASMHDAS
jgi:hypothetical protein